MVAGLFFLHGSCGAEGGASPAPTEDSQESLPRPILARAQAFFRKRES
jgi:hypothetical protein